jgi:hypothetical protein
VRREFYSLNIYNINAYSWQTMSFRTKKKPSHTRCVDSTKK